jgi:hypothetical protein
MIFLNEFLQPVFEVLADQFTRGKLRDYVHVFGCPSAFTINAVERTIFCMRGKKVNPQGKTETPAADRTKNNVMKKKSGHRN